MLAAWTEPPEQTLSAADATALAVAEAAAFRAVADVETMTCTVPATPCWMAAATAAASPAVREAAVTLPPEPWKDAMYWIQQVVERPCRAAALPCAAGQAATAC